MRRENLAQYKDLDLFRQFPMFEPDALFALSDLICQKIIVTKKSALKTEGHITHQGIYTGPELNHHFVILVTARAADEQSFTHTYNTVDFEVRRVAQDYYEGVDKQHLDTLADGENTDAYNAFRFRYRAATKDEATRRMYRLSEIAVMRPATADALGQAHPEARLPIQDDQYYHYHAIIDRTTDRIKGFYFVASLPTNPPGFKRPHSPQITTSDASKPDEINIEFAADGANIAITLPQIITESNIFHAY